MEQDTEKKIKIHEKLGTKEETYKAAMKILRAVAKNHISACTMDGLRLRTGLDLSEHEIKTAMVFISETFSKKIGWMEFHPALYGDLNFPFVENPSVLYSLIENCNNRIREFREVGYYNGIQHMEAAKKIYKKLKKWLEEGGEETEE